MFRTILVPLDRTRFAEAALPTAMRLAQRHGATLMLATVWLPAPIPNDDSATEGELWRWEQECREDDRRYMEVLARKVAEASGQRVIVRYLVGDPAEELAKLAARDGIDLAVAATHARAPLARALMKSVADRLARRGGVPLLLIRPGDYGAPAELTPSPELRHVLVPLDGSELAESALHRSLLAGLDPKTTEITLLQVVPFPALMVTPEPVATGELGSAVQAERAAGEEYLAAVAESLAPWARRATTKVVTSASTAGAIVDYAARHHVDLIAMGTHGRGGISRMLRGSVADAVVRNAGIPTLLFPPARVARNVQAAARSASAW